MVCALKSPGNSAEPHQLTGSTGALSAEMLAPEMLEVELLGGLFLQT